MKTIMDFRTVLCVLATGAMLMAPVTAARQAPLFVFSTDDFWLNLHQFLYVLGRVEAKMPDVTRRAVAGAPASNAAGLATLTTTERQVWDEAVRRYSEGPSRQDPVFDKPLIDAGNSLAMAGASPSLNGAALDPNLRSILDRVAPIYRKGWWTVHRASNERWREELEPLVTRHGGQLVRFVTRAYGTSWPTQGFPVRVVAFANWAGAFSTDGPLLLVSSQDAATTGLSALEIVLHESMHQWDAVMWELFLAEARRQKKYISAEITHALIFFTAGEAVRAVVPDHVPYAEANGIWTRGTGRFKPALEFEWRAWLHGHGTRDAAIADIVRRMPEAR